MDRQMATRVAAARRDMAPRMDGCGGEARVVEQPVVCRCEERRRECG